MLRIYDRLACGNCQKKKKISNQAGHIEHVPYSSGIGDVFTLLGATSHTQKQTPTRSPLQFFWGGSIHFTAPSTRRHRSFRPFFCFPVLLFPAQPPCCVTTKLSPVQGACSENFLLPPNHHETFHKTPQPTHPSTHNPQPTRFLTLSRVVAVSTAFFIFFSLFLG